MKQSLTDIAIKRFSTKSIRYDVWDTKVPNLGLRVFPSGSKTFFLSYYVNKHKKRDTIGRYPAISLLQARQQALAAKAQLALGVTPDAIAPRPVFSDTLKDFLLLHCERYNKPSTQRTTRLLLENECLPRWRDKSISEITRKDIIAVLDSIVDRGSTSSANRTYSAISKFFSWCVSRDLVQSNPFIGITRPSNINTRDRVLSNIEIKIVLRSAVKLGFPYGNIVHLLLLTAQRRGELTQMEWAHIDLNEKLWSIPQEFTKTNRPHNVPLSEQAIDVLESIPRLHDRFVFPARGSMTTSFSGFAKSKLRLDGTMLEFSGEPIPHWTLHDLRRTCATKCAILGVPPHIIERMLNHTSGTLGGVAGIYNRYGYLDEMRTALDQWGEHVISL